MHDAIPRIPKPVNEPVLDYAPVSRERAALDAELTGIAGEIVDIPCIIGGERVTTGRLEPVVMPHDHKHRLAQFHVASETEMTRAIAAARAAKREWEEMAWESRAAI